MANNLGVSGAKPGFSLGGMGSLITRGLFKGAGGILSLPAFALVGGAAGASFLSNMFGTEFTGIPETALGFYDIYQNALTGVTPEWWTDTVTDLGTVYAAAGYGMQNMKFFGLGAKGKGGLIRLFSAFVL